MSRDTAMALAPRDVIRLSGSRRGFGRKVVVTSLDRQSETIGVNYLPVIGGGSLLGENSGWTSLSNSAPVKIIGVWKEGALRPGESGNLELHNDDGTVSVRKGSRMATSTRAKKTTTARAKAKSNGGGESKRASADELDKLAARVVALRDDKGKSWGEIEEILEVAPGRLRSLYNRGGGEPTRKKQGSATKKGETSKEGKSAARGGKKTPARRSSRASSEDD
jgi:hypothetical protein